MATMPMATDEIDAGGDAGTATDDAASGPKVLLTVMSNGDGTYQLVQGDEQEAGEGSGEPSGDMGAGGEETGGADQGESYDDPGKLLKAILDIVKADMENSSGEGSPQQQFAAGFAGDTGAAKPPMQQKY